MDDCTQEPGAIRVKVVDLPDIAAHRGAWRVLAAGAAGALQPAYIEAAVASGLCDGDVKLLFAYAGETLVAAAGGAP